MRVLTLTTPDSENGLGCRVTLWFAGCSHHCPGCHNPHTWDYNQGTYIFDKKVTDLLYKEVNHDYIKGITLSGGDPLDQSDKSLNELLMVLYKFKEDFPDKDIWVYSGDTFENLIKNPIRKKILMICDVLVDGPFVKDLYDPDIAFRGSKNQRIIDLKQSFFENEIIELSIN